MNRNALAVAVLLLRINILNGQIPANIDFELSSPGSYTTGNAIQNWIVESAISNSVNGLACNANPGLTWVNGSPEFSIVSTPVLSFTNTPWSIDAVNILQSPLGGSLVARLNNSQAGAPVLTRMSTQFTVTPASNMLIYSYAGSWDGNHICCDQSAFRIDLFSCGSNSLIPCISQTFIPASQNCAGLSAGGVSVTSGVSWHNWSSHSIDLSAFQGQCLRMQVSVSDCVQGGHHGTAYFDAKLGNIALLAGNGLSALNVEPSQTGVNYCQGSNQAIISAPAGYQAYQWYAPGGFSVPPPIGQSQTLQVNGPIPGSVYTLVATSSGGCQYVLTYTMNYTQVSILSVSVTPSCLGGSSGAATVFASGSGTGYNYNWINSASLSVGSTSSVAGLTPGTYSLFVYGNPSLSCGTGSAIVTIASQTANIATNLVKPFCGTTAFLCAAPGTNYLWYNNLSPISGSLGSASCLTITSVVNGAIFRVRFSSNLGCQDSIVYTLVQANQIPLGISSSSFSCPGLSNGTATIQLFPVPGTPFAQNSFSVFSTGTLTPPFNFTTGPVALSSIILNNLSASTYSINVFDGSCIYTSSMSIAEYLLNFSVSPQSSTLCAGQSVAAGVNFSTSPSINQFSYAWSPNIWLAGNSQQITIIYPSLPPGTSSTIVYTVAVTPSVINCTFSKTLSVLAINPPNSTISPIPLLCQSNASYSVSASPGGGQFYSSNNSVFPTALNPSGIIIPNLVSPGTYSFTYLTSTMGCSASSVSSFTIGGPLISVSPSGSVCLNQATTLSVSGANSFTWSTGAIGSSILVSPTVNTTYTVSATHSMDPCVSSRTIWVVLPPTLQVSGNTSVCSTQGGTLFVSGASSYTWNTGQTTSSILINPVASTVYTVIGSSQLNACTSNTTLFVQVLPVSQVLINGQNTICSGNSITLIATGAASYTWNTGSNSNTLLVSPTSSFNYSIAASNSSNNCVSQQSFFINVLQGPTLSIQGPSGVCPHSPVTLMASGASGYTWSTGATTSLIQVFPQSLSVYSVLGSHTTNTCTTVKFHTITILPSPTLSVIGNSNMCAGESQLITVSGANSYTWSTGSTGMTLIVNPLSSGLLTYSVIGVNPSTSCTNSMGVNITVSDCTSMFENSITISKIQLSPNPCHEFSNLFCNEMSQVKIYNELGQEIFELTFESGTNRLNLSELSGGVYFLKVKQASFNKTIRLIKE